MYFCSSTKTSRHVNLLFLSTVEPQSYGTSGNKGVRKSEISVTLKSSAYLKI